MQFGLFDDDVPQSMGDAPSQLTADPLHKKAMKSKSFTVLPLSIICIVLSIGLVTITFSFSRAEFMAWLSSVCGAASWKTDRPLKYETLRPVSAIISVKHRPAAAAGRRVQSAAPRPTDRPRVSGDHVTTHGLTTTPDNSDVEDAGKSSWRTDAWKSRDPERGKNTNKKKPVAESISRRLERWNARGPECAGGFEDEVDKTKMMEDQFKQQVLRLQQQLGLTAEGYVLPP